MSSRLNGTDISYGFYLYHAPIIWTLVALHRQDDGSLWAMVLAPTILLALVSWFVIERPALRMKAVTDVLLSSKAHGAAAKNR
jgi:peptidoglycan/LPS O-acetylase OafA/YrhL